LKKLEEACGCDVPDDLKAIVLSVIEDHCKSCLSPISIDVVSLGTLPDEFKKLFNKLMQHVYSLKSKSRDLVLKVLKVFADYESGLADHEVCASRLSPRVAEHGTGIHKTNLDEVLFLSCFLFFVFILLYEI
jgi:molybdopterin-biosynthesis enzyme MoeA-like protein